MKRLLPFVMMAVICCGCKSKSDDPSMTSPDNGNASSSSTTQSSDAVSVENQNRIDADDSDEQQEFVSFPAVGVKLVRPEGFEDAENFYGFQQVATQSSVMVVKIPGPFVEVSRGFTTEGLQTRGIKLKSKENVEVEGENAVLLNVTQSAYGTDVSKWILAFGNEAETKLVTATFLQTEEANLSDELRAVVLSTKNDESPAPAPGADVGFSVTASPNLKLTSSMAKMLLYTKDGVIPAKSREDPLFICGPSLSKVPIEDKRQFAVQRLFQTANTKIGSVISNNEITIDGLDGFEIIAEAEDSDSGIPLRVYQTILYDDGSYVLMQGLVGESIAEQFLPEFKQMANSFVRDSP